MSDGKQDYDIFYDLSAYEDYKISAEGNYDSEKKSLFCNSIDIDLHQKAQIIRICRLFVKFFMILHDSNKGYGSGHISNKYPEFLNYWLNHHLIENSTNEKYHNKLYDCLNSYRSTFDPNNKLKDKIFDIQKYFKNINILYTLYKNYNDIKEKRSNDCHSFLVNCKEYYNKALEKCFQGGDYKLCERLKAFNKFYGNNKRQILTNCPDIKFPTLTEFILLGSGSGKSENQNIGYNLVKNNFHNFYNGLRTIEHRNYPDLSKLLSYKYNILFEHDAEENKNNMMNILKQFFQYCDENRKNEKLSYFMEEFIEQYYNKKKEEYNNIFSDCKANDKKKKYCNLYKECEKNFNNKESTIVWNTHEYIKQQKEYIESLTPLQLWIFKAQSMFQDFDAMSRISPTVMSTMVAIVVCLFFLYKLTPLSSIFRKEKKRRKIPLFFPERPINDVKNHNSENKNAKHKRGKIRFAYQPN
ncbi:unnamed protein product [Plasmodium vivax]|uniref:(malaria parasite P. vivax) hypothetical protein n=1 Tax=Plasmodium vivax TaxID=5855 RepID=A0A8S4HNJ9_PLAVI|nr:unnamed protein product [Plasmodium vivax]